MHLYLRINNLAGQKRKYIVDIGYAGKERLSLYVSADNILTFSFVDAKGEPHPLQLPFGRHGLFRRSGFPLARFAYCCCELGIGAGTTEMRMFLDGNEMASLQLPFKTDIGDLDVPNAVIGGDLAGDNNATFDLAETLIYSSTLLSAELKHNAKYMLTKTRSAYVEFNGNQWMRLADAPLGARHALQPDSTHAPTYRVIRPEG